MSRDFDVSINKNDYLTLKKRSTKEDLLVIIFSIFSYF